MTRDELLARIEEKGSHDFATLKYNPEGQKDIQDIYKALRAVLEIHKPDETYGSFCLACENGRCGNAQSVEYPCPTVQAIEREVKG